MDLNEVLTQLVPLVVKLQQQTNDLPQTDTIDLLQLKQSKRDKRKGEAQAIYDCLHKLLQKLDPLLAIEIKKPPTKRWQVAKGLFSSLVQWLFGYTPKSVSLHLSKDDQMTNHTMATTHMKRSSVAALLKSTNTLEPVQLCGWVRTSPSHHFGGTHPGARPPIQSFSRRTKRGEKGFRVLTKYTINNLKI